MRITAPNKDNCLGVEGSASASCTYKGMAVFLGRNNTSTFEVRGNGDDAIHGTVYGLRTIVQARGGGASPDEVRVVGQIIATRVYGNGNGSFKVWYEENEVYWKKPILSLQQ